MKNFSLKVYQGVTLPELVITIAIAAILFAVAMPSFMTSVRSHRLTTVTNELVSALTLARSEAIKRGQYVVIRKVGTNWEDGWRVFVDISRTASTKNEFNVGTDSELRFFDGLADSYTLRGNNNFVNFIAYQPDGTSNNIGSFAICESENVQGAKLVIVNAVGRMRIAPDSDHDGIPEKENGTEISSCTSGF
jgi:type IV fimbrial biogenesis protein FimT